MNQMADPWRHRYEQIHGLRFHIVEAGSGRPVILLHGFPEFWFSWRHQIPALAEAGFHVIAPDLRGYNETDKPRGVEQYRLTLLVDDIARLVEWTGGQRAVLVGHDWGGALAWLTALRYPGMVERLVILNAPHPAAFRRERRRLGQWLRSSYMLFFQLPWLPERLIRAGDYALLRRMLRREPVRPDAFTPDEIHRYRDALAQPGACTAALNYYRAAFRFGRLGMDVTKPMVAPTLLIWGERDRYLGLRLTEGLEAWVPHLQIVRLPNAGHWVQNDAPGEVNDLMVKFLAE